MSWRVLLLVLNIADVVSAAAAITGGIVTLVSIDDHRERLKLIWSFSEAANSMVGQGWHLGLCRWLIHTQRFDLVSSSSIYRATSYAEADSRSTLSANLWTYSSF
jgi:hypothetical protein